MYIQLEEEDLDRIAEHIITYGNTENASFYYSPLEIEVEFSSHVCSHIRGDYESGYSERVVDSVSFEVKPIKMDGVKVEYDSFLLDKMIENGLWED